MVAAAFDGDGNGIRLRDGKVKMAIETSNGMWRRRESAFDGGNGRRFALVFEGNGQQLWKRWTIETVFNGNDVGGV